MSDASGMTGPHIEAVTFLAGGQLPRALMEEVVARTSARLAVPCRLHVESWDAHARQLDGRDQFDADSLLLSLDATVAPGTIRIGLTAHDLGLALFTFVFGRAKKNGRAAIVSLARLGPERYGLPPDPELYASRTVAEVMHELGHVAGLHLQVVAHVDVASPTTTRPITSVGALWRATSSSARWGSGSPGGRSSPRTTDPRATCGACG